MSRRLVIIAAALQIVACLCSLALIWFTYSMRWTYLRPVYHAVQDGKDPYQAARDCADRLAFDFLWEAGAGLCMVSALSVICIVVMLKDKRPKTDE
jgi:hypothetical protein